MLTTLEGQFKQLAESRDDFFKRGQETDRKSTSATQRYSTRKLNRKQLEALCAEDLVSFDDRIDTAIPKKSAFNQFYLSEKFKDLLSLQTRHDRLTTSTSKIQGQMNVNLREATTQALTMIQRLQQETNENVRNEQSRSVSHLLQRVLATIQSHEFDIQKLNGLRYECMRKQQDGQIAGRKFLKIYKNFGINLNQNEQKDLFDFLGIGARKNCFNVDQLTKVCQVVAQMQFKKDLENNKETVEPRKSRIDQVFKTLHVKVGLAFSTAAEFVSWLSLSGRNLVKPEEFWFGIQFFSRNITFAEAMLLFQQLDESRDGYLDSNEVTMLLQNDPNQEKALSYQYGDSNHNLCYKNVQQVGASFDRPVMAVCDDLDLPKFQRARKERHSRKLHGRERVHSLKRSY